LASTSVLFNLEVEIAVADQALGSGTGERGQQHDRRMLKSLLFIGEHVDVRSLVAADELLDLDIVQQYTPSLIDLRSKTTKLFSIIVEPIRRVSSDK